MSKATTFIVKTRKGGIQFLSEFNKNRFLEFCRQNDGTLLEVKPKRIESGRQRGFFEGAVVPLFAYHQENLDHRDQEDLRQAREWLKLEYNASLLNIGGKSHLVAKTTKGNLQEFLERVIRGMEEMGIDVSVLNPTEYKNWKYSIYPTGEYDNYIDYLIAIKRI